jgi:hypothetical protein
MVRIDERLVLELKCWHGSPGASTQHSGRGGPTEIIPSRARSSRRSRRASWPSTARPPPPASSASRPPRSTTAGSRSRSGGRPSTCAPQRLQPTGIGHASRGRSWHTRLPRHEPQCLSAASRHVDCRELRQFARRSPTKRTAVRPSLATAEAAIRRWLASGATKARHDRLVGGYLHWIKRFAGEPPNYPGTAYVLLHSLSHSLMAEIALDCGYPASSLKERIYVLSGATGGAPDRCGILIYTATAGAQRTLGGLVGTAPRFAHILRNALERATICSNDPVCADHEPDDRSGDRATHGAACHGCLLIAETSCEMRNLFLDRNLLVPTMATDGAALFDVFAHGRRSLSRRRSKCSRQIAMPLRPDRRRPTIRERYGTDEPHASEAGLLVPLLWVETPSRSCNFPRFAPFR